MNVSEQQDPLQRVYFDSAGAAAVVNGDAGAVRGSVLPPVGRTGACPGRTETSGGLTSRYVVAPDGFPV